MIVKICGVTLLEDALAAAQAGADMIGLNFYAKSQRVIGKEPARALCAAMRAELGRGCPLFVGVFVNESVGNISIMMDYVGLDYVQCSGDESVEVLRELRGIAFKGIRPRNTAELQEDLAYFGPGLPNDERLPSLLLDAAAPGNYGGTGKAAPDDVAAAAVAQVPRLMLAGGLTPETVAARVQAIQPWGVDVASGVESGTPGRKDHEKIFAFIAAARSGVE